MTWRPVCCMLPTIWVFLCLTNYPWQAFDDIPLASYVWPALTTIRQHIRAMGKQSAELLIRHRLGNQSTDHLDRVIESKIVIRDSTGPAPQ